jgi:hypothetical protein
MDRFSSSSGNLVTISRFRRARSFTSASKSSAVIARSRSRRWRLSAASWRRSGRTSSSLHAPTYMRSRSGVPYFFSTLSSQAQARCATGDNSSKNIWEPAFSGLRNKASYTSRKAAVSNRSGGTSAAARGIQE